MPQLNFVKQGQGPVIVLSHALGCDLGMWDEVARLLESRFTVLRYDHRGHGRSEPITGPVTMASLAEDVAGLIVDQARRPVHFVGLSLGGMVGQALAVRYPQMVRSIVVANSGSHYDAAGRALWAARIQGVRDGGLASVADGILARWFTPEFRSAQTSGGAERVAAIRRTLLSTDPASYIACCEAISAMDLRSTNGLIHCPALVLAGARDEFSPVALSQAIALAISGAQLLTLDTAHLSAVEKPTDFSQLVADFIATV
jgi:3-oxoadipate enol-lactonase